MPFVMELLFGKTAGSSRTLAEQDEQEFIDLYNLGYVNNVSYRQPIAIIKKIRDNEVDTFSASHILQEPKFPCAGGCMVDPENPSRLLAATDGHVEFKNGKITVHSSLVIPGDIDASTGNIYFLGNLIVKGLIKSGFNARAKNLRVEGMEEGSNAQAGQSIFVEKGVFGSKKTMIEAGKDVRVGSCENATIYARGNFLVDRDCVNCRVYSGDHMAVKGVLKGGKVYVEGRLFVGQRLGGRFQESTKIILGYNPQLLIQAKRAEQNFLETNYRLSTYKIELNPSRPAPKDINTRLKVLQNKVAILEKQKELLWEQIDEELGQTDFSRCFVAVVGEVFPGVEINIGKVPFETVRNMKNVRFFLREDEITVKSPAISEKNKADV